MAHRAQTDANLRTRHHDRFANAEPAVDADFETIKAAPKQAVETDGTPVVKTLPLPSVADLKMGMSVFAKKTGKSRRDDSVAFYGFSAALILLSFWVSGGHSVFKNMQMFKNIDMASTSGIRAIGGSPEIVDAAWRVVTINGKSALHIEGIVRNSGSSAIHTKPVTVSVKQTDGSSNRYLLGQKGWTLGPGQEVVVSGRLDIAPASIASVVIALTN